MDDKMRIHILQAQDYAQSLEGGEPPAEHTELGNRIHAMAEKLGMKADHAVAGAAALRHGLMMGWARESGNGSDEALFPSGRTTELFVRSADEIDWTYITNAFPKADPTVLRDEAAKVIAGRTYEVSRVIDWTSGEDTTTITDVTRPDTFRVIGVDGGGTAGIGILDLEELDEDGRFYTKITPTLLEIPGDPAAVLNAVVLRHPDAVAVEDFVTLRRSARLSGWKKGGKRAADTAAVLAAEFAELDIQVGRNTANRVKRWANAFRMAAAGIRKPGLTHAVDGARHALFLAVDAKLIEDPLLVQRRRAEAHRAPKEA